MTMAISITPPPVSTPPEDSKRGGGRERVTFLAVRPTVDACDACAKRGDSLDDAANKALDLYARLMEAFDQGAELFVTDPKTGEAVQVTFT